MIYFTSDLHFFHENVIRYCNRPYDSVQEMNEMLIKNWNDTVNPEDTVYCLGDFSLAIRPVELYTRRLNGYKILVSGNHDWTHPCNRKSKTPEKAQSVRKQYYEHGWNEIHQHSSIDYKDVKFNLSHLPYKGDLTDDRKFDKHRLEDDGNPLLCGHVHQHWKTKFTTNGTLMINVGVDVWEMKPISIDTVYDLWKQNSKTVK